MPASAPGPPKGAPAWLEDTAVNTSSMPPATSGAAAIPSLAPVTEIPGDSRPPEPGTALCLSGGGSRAMLFHAGALIRMNELGLLPTLDRVSSVSGGSIAAGALARAWPSLAWSGGVATNLQALVVEPLRELARHRIDVPTFLLGTLLPRQTPATRFADVLDEHLYHGATLGQLPDRPRFVINATNLASRVLWRFEKPYMRDYLVGEVAPPNLRLAIAVAASSAFPPAFSPLWLDLSPDRFTAASGSLPDEYRRRIPLGDGGVYDNLGLETAWKRYLTILVSDGGGETAPDAAPRLNPVSQVFRVMKVIDRQVRSLRKRLLIDGYKTGLRTGAYWGIRTGIADYKLADVLPCPPAATAVLAAEPTRLTKMSDVRQERLINWGYAVADAALRAHVVQGRPRGEFPYPKSGIGDARVLRTAAAATR